MSCLSTHTGWHSSLFCTLLDCRLLPDACAPASHQSTPSSQRDCDSCSKSSSPLQERVGELPDDVLHALLHLRWSLDKRKRTPAEEVRCALQLSCVSRCVGQVLRAQPLPLRLDFSWPLWHARCQDSGFKQEHVAWLDTAAQRDSVAALTLPGWDMSREHRSESVTGKRVSRSLTVELLQALASNQRWSLRRLHGISSQCVGRGFQQVDLSAFALTHLGLVLEEAGQGVCAAALPVTLESLVYCEESEWGSVKALQNVWSLPRLTCMHMKCTRIVVASSLAPCWCGKHVALTAEDCVTIFCDTRPDGAKGLFGVASTVYIVADSITFRLSVHGGESAEFTELASVLCPDTLAEAVLDMYGQVGLTYVTAQYAPVDWALLLYALICERGNVFAFEVDMRFSRVRIAWRKWPPRGSRAHKAAAELHRQAVEWVSFESEA